MKENKTIINELKEIAPIIASIQKKDLFIVPDSYFDNLADKVLDKIKVEGAENQKNTPLTIPDGYFNNLASNIISKIKNEQSEVYRELEDIAPLLNSISKLPVYTIPDGYFEGFKAETCVSKISTARVISFSKTRKWISYAAAAIMAGVLVTGAFIYTDQPNTFNLSKEVNKLSDEELISYMNSEHSVVFTPDSINLGPGADVQSDLKLISDDELKQYMEENRETLSSTDHKDSKF